MPPQADHFIRFGLPFIVFVVGGYGALSVVMRGRMEVRDARAARVDLMLDEGSLNLPGGRRKKADRPEAGGVDAEVKEYEMKRIPR